MKRRRTGMCVPLNLPIWRSISRTVLIGIGSCLRHSESPVKISIQNMSDKYSSDAILWITSECIRTQRQFKQRYYFKSICVQDLPVRFLFVFLWIWAATHYILSEFAKMRSTVVVQLLCMVIRNTSDFQKKEDYPILKYIVRNKYLLWDCNKNLKTV